MKDAAVALENRPGALADMGEGLGSAGISIEGGGVFASGSTAIAHFLFADDAPVRDTVRRGQEVADAWMTEGET